MKIVAGWCLLIFLVANGISQGEVLDANDLDAIRAKCGMEAVVEGLVHDIGMTKDSRITFINMGMPKKRGFVALLFQKDYAAFPDGLDQFRNRTVRVKGVVEIYRKETPQIVLTSPDQIEIVAE